MLLSSSSTQGKIRARLLGLVSGAGGSSRVPTSRVASFPLSCGQPGREDDIPPARARRSPGRITRCMGTHHRGQVRAATD